jgi:hypothetical protein
MSDGGRKKTLFSISISLFSIYADRYRATSPPVTPVYPRPLIAKNVGADRSLSTFHTYNVRALNSNVTSIMHVDPYPREIRAPRIDLVIPHLTNKLKRGETPNYFRIFMQGRTL